MIKTVLKYLLLTLLCICIFTTMTLVYFYYTADILAPEDLEDYKPELIEKKAYNQAGESVLKLNPWGVWELRTEGEAYRRGCEQGALMQSLIQYQEEVFVERLNHFVPAEHYQKILLFLMRVFNSRLAAHVPEEYKREIAGIAQYCSSDYDFMGTPYQRQLSYHAAHDIGHAMQKYMLVGCTSFASWGNSSKDSLLLIARNFDFYICDEFAHNRLISMVKPEQGYAFLSVGWPGMIGVLSGMNDQGLCVTINAAQGSLPMSGKTPISILTRMILQYASSIDEAYAIAEQYDLFVSESILIGSAKDGKAAIIEKTPESMALYQSDKDYLICSNHFQSESFAKDPLNQDNIKHSDSQYRYDRVEELIREKEPLNKEACLSILREKKGLGNEALGLSNPMAINQLIAHHGVIFSPLEKKMWVSTGPWQEGAWLAYDLHTVFEEGFEETLCDTSAMFEADSSFIQGDYRKVVRFRHISMEIKRAIKEGFTVDNKLLNEMLLINPDYYYSHALLGDYYWSQGSCSQALDAWDQALELPIPSTQDKQGIVEKMEMCRQTQRRNQ